MSTWGTEDETAFLYGVIQTSDSIDLGGDISYLSLSQKDYEHSFFMQREGSIALNWQRKYFLLGSFGLYGEKEKPESREYLIQAEILPFLHVRAGRFYPAFGIMSNEHKYFFRAKHWNQGRETLNAEAVYRSENFEISAAKIFGHPDDFENGYLKGKEGWASRVNYFPDKTGSVGVSYAFFLDQYYNTEHIAALHGMYAFNQFIWIESQIGNEDFYGRIGIEPYKGFSVKPTLEYEYKSRLYNSELVFQWLPRPHFDFQLTCSKTTWALLLHYYL
jgi:hypothetical protein